MMPKQKNSKNIASLKTSVFKKSKNEYGAELFKKLETLQKANEEIRKASQVLGGDDDFQRGRIIGMQFIELHPKWTLGFRGRCTGFG